MDNTHLRFERKIYASSDQKFAEGTKGHYGYSTYTDHQEYADAMGNRLLNIHISDGKGEKLSLLPGKGEFDYHQFFNYLSQTGYSNFTIIEIYSNDFCNLLDFEASKRFLETEITKFCQN